MLFVSHSACVDLSIIYFWLYLLKWKTQPIYASCISKHTVTYCNDCNCYDCYVLYVRSVVFFFFFKPGELHAVLSPDSAYQVKTFLKSAVES